MMNSYWLRIVLLLLLSSAGCATSSMARRDCGGCGACGEGCRMVGGSTGVVACGGHCQENGRRGNCRNANCRREDDLCPDAIPAKPGTYVNNWNNAMRCAAKSDEFVIRRNAWFNGGPEPGPEAVQRIQQLAVSMSQQDDHLLLEQEPVLPKYDETLAEATARTQQLNDARQSAVVNALQTAGIADAAARVHLASPQSVGIRGIEAPRVFNQLFQGGGRGGRGGGQNTGGGLGGGGGGIGGGGVRF
ncbi:MAG: hypothetical protein R3C59_13920 [Planctomycetaceae bacterium]